MRDRVGFEQFTFDRQARLELVNRRDFPVPASATTATLRPDR